MKLEQISWHKGAFEMFEIYMDFNTVLRVSRLPLMAVKDKDTEVGFFTYALGDSFDGQKLFEIRHMVGSFDPAGIYDALKQLEKEGGFKVRVVSDRPGFDKICHDNGFKKISTIWELQ